MEEITLKELIEALDNGTIPRDYFYVIRCFDVVDVDDILADEFTCIFNEPLKPGEAPW